MALLETPAAGRYGFHDLIRLFAREHMPTGPDAGALPWTGELTFYRDTAKDWLTERSAKTSRTRTPCGGSTRGRGERPRRGGGRVCARRLGDRDRPGHLSAPSAGTLRPEYRTSATAVPRGRRGWPGWGCRRGGMACMILLAEKMVWRGMAAQTLEALRKVPVAADETGDPGDARMGACSHRGCAAGTGGVGTGAPGVRTGAGDMRVAGGHSEERVGADASGLCAPGLGELDGAERMYREALKIADGAGGTGFRAGYRRICLDPGGPRADGRRPATRSMQPLASTCGTEDLVGQERDAPDSAAVRQAGRRHGLRGVLPAGDGKGWQAAQ